MTSSGYALLNLCLLYSLSKSTNPDNGFCAFCGGWDLGCGFEVPGFEMSQVPLPGLVSHDLAVSTLPLDASGYLDP